MMVEAVIQFFVSVTAGPGVNMSKGRLAVFTACTTYTGGSPPYEWLRATGDSYIITDLSDGKSVSVRIAGNA